MNCPTCGDAMTRVKSGGVCLRCNGKIHPWVDGPQPCVPDKRNHTPQRDIPNAHFVDMDGLRKRWKIDGLAGFYWRVNSWAVWEEPQGRSYATIRRTTPGVPIKARIDGKSCAFVLIEAKEPK